MTAAPTTAASGVEASANVADGARLLDGERERFEADFAAAQVEPFGVPYVYIPVPPTTSRRPRNSCSIT